jgi:hypothetical protein
MEAVGLQLLSVAMEVSRMHNLQLAKRTHSDEEVKLIESSFSEIKNMLNAIESRGEKGRNTIRPWDERSLLRFR